MKIIKNISISLLLLSSNLIISMENNQEDKIKDLYNKFERLNYKFDRLFKLNNFILDKPQAISEAINKNNEEILDILLKDNAIDPNIIINASNETALIQASSSGNLNIVKKLIEAGANLDKKLQIYESEDNNNSEKTIFYFAKNLEILKYLLELSKDNKNLLERGIFDIIEIKILENLQLFLKYFNDVNIKDKNNWTPFLKACLNCWPHKDNLNIIKLLIENKANINDKNIFGETALKLALQSGNYKVMQLLLENNANLYFHTKFPIQYDEENFDEENSFLKLIDNLSSHNKRGKENINKLLTDEVNKVKSNILNSIKNNDIQEFKKNILRIGTICIKDKDKNNLLHHAIKLNNLEIAKFIWSLKPDLIVEKNIENKTPFDLLNELGILFQDQEIINLLKK